ncbi:DUF1801 domain-containing protein [Sanyastnella coralliicola]|uniref:DUF1801 domain-containing protein n=1 Tax=Sanyastnella coralliicola TaxID=3069118 RepID=UPI0027B9EEE2|nr:DUF1801 domain-containing protein [Longitalea sp. SCSIO 12813]
MSGLATQETNKNVDAFIDSIENASKQADARVIRSMMEEISGAPAKIWGDNFIVGFGKYTYQRKGSKQEYEWFKVGFAPRKSKITLYLMLDLKSEQELVSKLGKCKHGAGCLYINKLADIDQEVLKVMIKKSVNS